jgi:hypothetical protein
LRVIEQPVAVQGRRPLLQEGSTSRSEKEINQCVG